MDPLRTALALDPLFAVSFSVVARVQVNLGAEVAVLALLVGLRAELAPPDELPRFELSSRPLLVFISFGRRAAIPVAAKLDSFLSH